MYTYIRESGGIGIHDRLKICCLKGLGVRVPSLLLIGDDMRTKEYDVIVLSGGFDPIHVGHLRMIQDSAERAKIVVVGVNSDAWLKRKKGYIFMPHEERLEMVSGVQGVYEAVSFDDSDNSACDLIRKIKEQWPNFKIAFANGGDRTTKNTPEQDYCNQNDIDMLWGIGGDYKAQSSSTLVEKVNPSHQKGFARYNKEN